MVVTLEIIYTSLMLDMSTKMSHQKEQRSCYPGLCLRPKVQHTRKDHFVIYVWTCGQHSVTTCGEHARQKHLFPTSFLSITKKELKKTLVSIMLSNHNQKRKLHWFPIVLVNRNQKTKLCKNHRFRHTFKA